MTEELLEIKELKDICQQIADVYKQKMQQAGYDQQGELYKFTWVTEYEDNLFSLYFNLPDYWQWAENGRKPGGFPPPNAILKWVQFKRLVPKANNGKVPSTNQLVYVISKKIAENGTKGKHLLQQTIDETYDTLVDQLISIIADALDKELDNDIENLY